jgi:hypothetical protein
MTDPHKDEHIEELLSKLQGIFGKLSRSEEEEAKSKIEVAQPAPKEPDLGPDASSPTTPVAPGTPVSPPPLSSIPLYQEPPAPGSTSPALPEETPGLGPAPADGAPSVPSTIYESIVPLEDPEKLIVPTAVFYVAGRENEAKMLAQKLETMAPKFTKVAFRLRVGTLTPYDPRSDWKETVLSSATDVSLQTAFVLVDRGLEDSRRKQIALELEARNIYFQEVPYSSLEKKAFYTDVLLGLVFFLDSRKPATEEPKP